MSKTDTSDVTKSTGATTATKTSTMGCPASIGGSQQTDYKNLFGRPEEEAGLQGGALASLQAHSRDTLEKLVRCCGNEFDWSWNGSLSVNSGRPDVAGQGRSESNIPAGYTYLAQLVAHDMVQTAAGLDWAWGCSGSSARNHRVTPLVLDTLYGGGPLVTPLAYEIGNPNKPPNQQRVKLVTSRPVKTAGVAPEAKAPFRDIGRINCPFERTPKEKLPTRVISGQEGRGKSRRIFRQALIADPRNDDNLFLSQLLTVFVHFHASVFDLLSKQRETSAETPLVWYRIARQIVTNVYRNIVRMDLLPRLLCDPVYKKYEQMWAAGTGFLDTSEDERMSVEFSHAAYRFGHSMIRDNYRVNDKVLTGELPIKKALDFTSDGGNKAELPLKEAWWIQWRHFFDFRSYGKFAAPQMARRIGPGFVEGLDEAGIVPHFEGESSSDVFHQDIVRSAESRTRSVASLYHCLPTELLPARHGLHERDTREMLLEEWLDTKATEKDIVLSAKERIAICSDPPLAFYVLFEAAIEQKGNALGLLGSVIVAETIYRALATTRSVFEENRKLISTCNHLFGQNGTPNDMVSMIGFVEKTQGTHFA